VPVALFLAGIVFVRGRSQRPAQRAVLLVAAVAVMLVVAADLGVLAIGIVLALLVATVVLTAPDEDRVPVENVQ